jgi:parallel beta-helix repeat protein
MKIQTAFPIFFFFLLLSLSVVNALPIPVSEWKFENNVLDTYGINNGTRYNFADGWVSGKYGNALDFNSTAEQFVDVGNDSSLNFGTGDFSVEAWIKTYCSEVNWMAIVTKYDTENLRGINLYLDYKDFIAFATDGESTLIPSTICDNEWHHIFAVRDGYYFLIYVDGELIISEEHSVIENVSNTAPFLIGSLGGIQEYFNGTMDNVRIYDYALTDEEVWELYSTLEISDCSELNETGAIYYQTADINESNATVCMNISADNIVFDCRGYSIDGDSTSGLVGIEISSTNVTVKNCNLNNWIDYGIWLDSSYNGTLFNLTLSNIDYGIYLHLSYNNTFFNLNVNNNNYGITLSQSYDNIFYDLTSEGNDYGIDLDSSYNNTFFNLTLNNNDRGIELEPGTIGNIFYSLSVSDSTSYCIHFNEYTEEGYTILNNTFYNDLFNNSVDFYCYDYYIENECVGVGSNYWNTTQQSGANIWNASLGYIGGNFWTNSSNNDFSNTCTDADYDGFCDDPYTLAENNTDYLPIATEVGQNIPTCIEPYENMVITENTTLCTGHYYLNESGSYGFTAIYLQQDNIFLDCNNSIIEGNGTDESNGILWDGQQNNTLLNCEVLNYAYGVRVHNSNNNVLENISSHDNLYYGIYFYNTNSSNVSNSTAYNNAVGFPLEISYYNKIRDNLAYGNENGFMIGGSSNVLENNTAHDNSGGFGFYISSDSHYNNITDCVAYGNSEGIHLDGSNNMVAYCNSSFNSNYGIALFSVDGNEVSYSITQNNTVYGLYLYNSSNSNLNNLIASGMTAGVQFENASYNNLTNITAFNNVNGVYLYGSSNNTFYNFTSNSNTEGVYLSSSSNNTFYNFTSNNNYDGVYLYLSSNNTLYNFTSNSNYIGVYLSYSNSSTLSNITADSNYYGIYLEFSESSTLSNITANSNDYGIYFEFSESNTLSNTTVDSNSNSGIYLEFSNSSTFSDIIVSNSGLSGIYLYESSNNTLTNITADSNDDGIYLYSSSNNTLTNNTVNNNYASGIWLDASTFNTLTNNIAFENILGIVFWRADNNSAVNNTIISNSEDGLKIQDGNGNNVANNIFRDNPTGIRLVVDVVSVQDNNIYNNLLNDTTNVIIEGAIGENFWNTTATFATNIVGGNWTGGNYWTNSTGNGYSDICSPVSHNFCEPYEIASYDYLPLSTGFYTPMNITVPMQNVTTPIYANLTSPKFCSRATSYPTLLDTIEIHYQDGSNRDGVVANGINITEMELNDYTFCADWTQTTYNNTFFEGNWSSWTRVIDRNGAVFDSDYLNFTVETPPPYLSVTFNYTSVDFGSLSANTTNTSASNQLDGIYNVSVDTNYAYYVLAVGTEFSDGGGHMFPIYPNLIMDTNSTAANLNVAQATIIEPLMPGPIDSYTYDVTTNYHGYWLSIPAGQYAGAYSSTVTITYENI